MTEPTEPGSLGRNNPYADEVDEESADFDPNERDDEEDDDPDAPVSERLLADIGDLPGDDDLDDPEDEDEPDDFDDGADPDFMGEESGEVTR